VIRQQSKPFWILWPQLPMSAVAMAADWICGYYGFGSLMALLTVIWLMRQE